MYPYYVLAVLSVFLFLQGFFPVVKPIRNSNLGPPTHINNITLDFELYNSDIKKTVIVVIDALRLDFINTEYMPLISRISDEIGCINTVIVETPTVTLPRIKALTTGNVPQFIDVVLNLASTEVLEDSLLHSMIKKGKRVVFYGDNTWLKLFPNFFMRFEGTSSFFVKDFKEVDDNVTRNVFLELKAHDWDVMILHYLGLDHIGHVYGPFAPQIPNKLQEMDQIIYHIYSELSKSKDNFLLIVTGDHGMRDSGGHGGASYSEIHVPLVVIGHRCDNESLFQIDIPVNLAVLLGLNIPSTSIGQIRENLLPITLEKYLFALRYNNLLLLDRANLCEEYFLNATKFHEMYLKMFNESLALQAINLYKNCSSSISEYLIKSSVNQNFMSLINSIILMLNILIVLVQNLIIGKFKIRLFRTAEYLTYLVIITMNLLTVNSIMFVIILVVFLMNNLIIFFNGICLISEDALILLILIGIIHPFTFFSSSFVEEEHQFWYFFHNVFIIYTALLVLSRTRKWHSIIVWIFFLCAFRFLRTINSTGDKWASYPDFSDWLLENDNYIYYQVFFIVGLCASLYTSSMILKTKYTVNMFLNFVIFICIFLLKSICYENILLGKIIWLLILCNFVAFHGIPKIITWIFILSLLLKPYNLMLISYCIWISISFSKVYRNTTTITLCHFLLSNALYFSQGHSNSLASIDISVGYTGLSEYQPLLVISQVLSHTYSFPILCHFLVLQNKEANCSKIWTVLFCIRLYITVITSVITVMFRHHLFIWSVFAPKLFIECIHLILLFIEISIYFGFKTSTIFTKLCNFWYPNEIGRIRLFQKQ